MNRFIGGTLVLLVVMTAGTGGALAEIAGLRGATWGDLRYEIPKEGVENLVLDGWIKQGIDLAKWGNTSLNTYAKLRFKWDTEGYDWNNLMGPTVGISFDTFVPAGLSGSLGVEYSWESRTLDGINVMDQKTMIYLTWYGWWDLKD
jgi:hypothetical protein